MIFTVSQNLESILIRGNLPDWDSTISDHNRTALEKKLVGILE